jgi:hypothetical protein
VAIALTVAGGVLAIVGFLKRDDPAAAVRGYFAALRRADAPAALGYGDLPGGDHQLLTSNVLRAQREAGAISRLAVLAVDQSGDRAIVLVQYSLGQTNPGTVVTDRVELVRRDKRWRMTAVAVPVELSLPAAKHRATILDAPVPTGSVLMFPGALPITLDTPNLALADGTSTVRFSGVGLHTVSVLVSPRAKKTITTAVVSALERCLAAATNDPSCPLPKDDRAIPGTLHGSLTETTPALSTQLMSDPDGRIEITGTLTVNGSYRRLNFDNMSQTQSGSAQVQLAAICSANSPTSIVWKPS